MMIVQILQLQKETCLYFHQTTIEQANIPLDKHMHLCVIKVNTFL